MEASLPKTVLNSFSRFGSLSSSTTVSAELVQRYYLKIDETLEPLKHVLQEVSFSKQPCDEKLNNVLKDLDAAVNEARELIENWHQMMSKVYFVMQIETVIAKLHTYALEASQLFNTSLADDSSTMCTECMLKIQQIHYDQVSPSIKEAMRAQVEKRVPSSEHLERISKYLGVLSNRELLMEAVSLDKLKGMATRSENNTELESINQMIALINCMHDCHVKMKQLHSINGVPIPADFCCPLSLELMSDPVIVASGQTYERAFIKQWLDQGFNICPKTRQTLSHTTLIPNYTVKALIANWCESNDIKLPDPIKSMNLSLPSGFLSLSDSSPNGSVIPLSNQSPRVNHPRSPDVSIKDSNSSNGVHLNNCLHDQPTSHHVHIANGCEANLARMSLGITDGKESSLEEGHAGSGSQNLNQLRPEPSQDQMVNDQFQGHSRSVSAASAVSNNGYHRGGDTNTVSRASSDLSHYSSDASGEVTQDSPTISAPPREPEVPSRLAERSRSQSIWRRPSERFVPRIISSSSIESRPDLSGVETEVRKLIEDLKSDFVDLQRAATAELRLLAKHNMENRIVIANCGAISLLVGLLHSADPKTQENAVTALLNLSINDNNKTAIANADAIEPLIHVLETGDHEARENAAATLFSLSVIEENKVRIGRSNAVKPLVKLLGDGTPRGKRDAATALFNLSIFHENKARIVQAGAVRHLVDLMDPAAGMVDKAVAVLANLATIPEGRHEIGQQGGIPVLVQVVELGSSRGKENAAAALLQLCTNSHRFCNQVLQEGAVPPLVALSQSGTPRAREKAQGLLSYFRNQRHGNAGRP